jgi:hypothetical protein
MDVSGLLHTLPSLIQVKNPGTPGLVSLFLRREKVLSLRQFKPWTIQMVEKHAVHTTTLRLPKYHPKTSLCHVRTLIETHPLCRRQDQLQSQSELVQKI